MMPGAAGYRLSPGIIGGSGRRTGVSFLVNTAMTDRSKTLILYLLAGVAFVSLIAAILIVMETYR